jgi:hypothetical protein
MNINSLVDKIINFKDIIEERGYLRDVQGFSTTLSQPNTNQNIILLKDIMDKLNVILQGIYQSSIPDDMLVLLPNEKNYQFSSKKYNERLVELIDDTKMTTQTLHGQLIALINDIKNHINNNMSSISSIESVFLPYYEKENVENKKNEKAIIAIIFNNKGSYQNLSLLLKTLTKWNKLFKIYSQLMKSDSPEDIEIVSINDGSIDFIFNFNIDLSIDLTEIVKYGLIALGGFFSYIKAAKPIIDSYLGNKALIDSENERKELLLDNVHKAISSKIKEQHEKYIKKNPNINKESVDKKIDEVSKIITEHLIEGNEVRLLISANEKANELTDEVKEKAQIIKNEMKEISRSDILLLENKYKIKDDDN